MSLRFRKRSGVRSQELAAMIAGAIAAPCRVLIDRGDGKAEDLRAVDVVTLSDGSTALLLATRSHPPGWVGTLP